MNSKQVIPAMPSIKNLEDRMDICCENIRSRISLMEAYTGDSHAVNIQCLMSLAQKFPTVDINNHIIMCDNTIKIIGELKNLLKFEERRRNLQIQLNDCEREQLKDRTKEKKRFNPYQIKAATTEQAPVPIRRQKST